MIEPLEIPISDGQRTAIVSRLLDGLCRSPSGCWEWVRSRNPAGYGKISIKHKLYKSHRVAFVLFCGPIPSATLVCHHCDNPACCKPTHLFLGDTKDNSADMLRKGRQGGGGASIPLENRKHGTKCEFAKLSNEQVEEIRRNYRPRVVTYKMLAKKYKVCPHTIRNVIRKKTWAFTGVTFSSPASRR